MPVPSSSCTDDEDVQKEPVGSQTSDVPRRKIRKTGTTIGDRATRISNSESPKAKIRRLSTEEPAPDDDEDVAHSDTYTEAREQFKNPGRNGNRQASPDWPTILFEDDQPEGLSMIEAGESKLSRSKDVESHAETDLSNAKEPNALPPSEPLKHEDYLDTVESPNDAKGADVLVQPNGEKEPLRNLVQQSNQHYENDSCSPSLDAESYADMLAQALDGSSGESSSLIMDFGAVVEGDQVLVRNGDQAEQDEYLDGRSVSQCLPCAAAEALDQNPPREYGADRDYHSTHTAERCFHVPCAADEEGHEGVLLDAELDPVEGMLPCADSVDQSFPDISHVALESDMLRPNIVIPAPDISTVDSATPDIEVGAGAEVKNNTLDIFGTDAEQARKALYGTRAYR